MTAACSILSKDRLCRLPNSARSKSPRLHIERSISPSPLTKATRSARCLRFPRAGHGACPGHVFIVGFERGRLILAHSPDLKSRSCLSVQLHEGSFAGCGICATSPFCCGIETTTMKTTISTKSTSIIDVMLISALSAPLPAVENEIGHSSPARARLCHWTMTVAAGFPSLAMQTFSTVRVPWRPQSKFCSAQLQCQTSAEGNNFTTAVCCWVDAVGFHALAAPCSRIALGIASADRQRLPN
jgi:hypothetical protein